ncbi:MAG: hypothetical protein NTY38_08100 [Acidobacteria bacterium]|nr:hypothetical protein [Acidobacteriota bacterium]
MHENGVCGEAEALGCAIAYRPDIPPHVADPVIKSFDDVDNLTVPDPENTFPLNELLKATRILVRETKGQAFVMGRADQGPMALAAALCGPEKLLLAVMDPDLRPKVLQLLDICSRMNLAYGAAQQRAGAHGTSLGVYGRSMISPKLFRDLELPRLQTFCQEMCRLGLRTFVHSCGNETALLESLIATGASCLELDPRTDPDACKRAIRGRVSVLGMLEPAHVLCQGTVGQVRAHTLEMLRILAPGGDFIMGPGCALPGDTPRENIHAVMECSRAEGVYAPDGSLPNLRG